MSLKLYYCLCGRETGRKGFNFGDLITPYLCKAITGKDGKRSAGRGVIVGAGSVLHMVSPGSIIWGTGAMYKDRTFSRPAKILAVRGPLTRKACLDQGFDCPEVYGDPGLLMPLFYHPPKPKQTWRVGIIPHYIDFVQVKKAFAKRKGILIIDLLKPFEKVIDEMVSCSYLFSSSLHGILVSHAYGIPTVWTEFSSKISGDSTKYHDYYGSVGLGGMKPMDGRVLHGKGLEDLVRRVKSYPQPTMPMDLRPLLKVCPFEPGDFWKGRWEKLLEDAKTMKLDI